MRIFRQLILAILLSVLVFPSVNAQDFNKRSWRNKEKKEYRYRNQNNYQTKDSIVGAPLDGGLLALLAAAGGS